MAKVFEVLDLFDAVETVCFLYDKKKEEDLGMASDELPAKLSFRLSNVCHHRECSDNGEITKDRCIVYFKSGESTLIGMSYSELLEKLKTYWAKI